MKTKGIYTHEEIVYRNQRSTPRGISSKWSQRMSRREQIDFPVAPADGISFESSRDVHTRVGRKKWGGGEELSIAPEKNNGSKWKRKWGEEARRIYGLKVVKLARCVLARARISRETLRCAILANYTRALNHFRVINNIFFRAKFMVSSWFLNQCRIFDWICA